MKLKVDFRTEQGLKRSNELELFRRLNTLSSKPAKQIDHDEIIDLLRLCQNSDLTPAFAKVDKTKHKKWRGSFDQFARNVIGKNFVTNPLSSKPAKQIDHDEIIDLLRLCQNSDLTPAFAKIDKTKHKKWRGSSDHFARNVIGKNKSKKNFT